MTDAAAMEARLRSSFAKQGLMQLFGASITRIAPGQVEISLAPKPELSQHGFVHGGALTAIADSAAGYAALSLMPANSGVLTTEMKINFLAPAAGDHIIARGKVLKAGRTLSLVQTEIFAVMADQERLIAFLTATFMTMENRDGIED
ncbi:MAG: PaaI family thioesterase [Acetobacteraceae bacterium]|nr:PaaI family thioesterase [Acetobacteraceae bacterium]